LLPRRIENYERGRVPLPYRIVSAIYERWPFNLEWLATGVGGPDDATFINGNFAGKVHSGAYFSDVFDQFIKTDLQYPKELPLALIQNLAAAGKLDGFQIKASPIPGRITKPMVARLLAVMLNDLPPRLYLKFYGHMKVAADQFRLAHNDIISGSLNVGELIAKKGNLTNVPNISNISDMKAVPQLPGLIARLKKATQERGKKTQLAKFLGVPLPKVSEWLAGKYDPSGETALQMLRWLDQ